jgi:hypothetical protein
MCARSPDALLFERTRYNGSLLAKDNRLDYASGGAGLWAIPEDSAGLLRPILDHMSYLNKVWISTYLRDVGKVPRGQPCASRDTDRR